MKKNKKDEVPCEMCLLIPVCRSKFYSVMLDDCSLLRYHLYKRKGLDYNRNNRTERFNSIFKIIDILKPLRWRAAMEKNRNLEIRLFIRGNNDPRKV